MTIVLTTDPHPTLTLNLTAAEAKRIEAAQSEGVDVSALLKSLIDNLPVHDPELSSSTLHSGMRLADLLAPLRDDFKATGLTDEELGEFVDEVLAGVRAGHKPACRAELSR